MWRRKKWHRDQGASRHICLSSWELHWRTSSSLFGKTQAHHHQYHNILKWWWFLRCIWWWSSLQPWSQWWWLRSDYHDYSKKNTFFLSIKRDPLNDEKVIFDSSSSQKTPGCQLLKGEADPKVAYHHPLLPVIATHCEWTRAANINCKSHESHYRQTTPIAALSMIAKRAPR